MRSVDTSKIDVRPLPSDKDLVSCTSCRKAQARWELAKGLEIAIHFVCSICLLYRLPAMQAQRPALDGLIEAVEKTIGTRFDREADGSIQHIEDANRIAYGIVMAQRYERSRGLQ